MRIFVLFFRVISINQKSAILRTAIENGGQPESDFAFQQYQATGNRDFLVATTCSTQPTVLSG